MRLGAHIGPFYASTSTRRRRKDEIGFWPIAIVILAIVLPFVFWPWESIGVTAVIVGLIIWRWTAKRRPSR